MSVPHRSLSVLKASLVAAHVWLSAIPKPVPGMGEGLLCASGIRMH